MEDSLNNILASTKEAQKALLKLTNEERNLMLRNIYEAIDNNREYILKENEKDIKLAKDALIKDSMIERLTLNDKRIDEHADSCNNGHSGNGCIAIDPGCNIQQNRGNTGQALTAK